MILIRTENRSDVIDTEMRGDANNEWTCEAAAVFGLTVA